MLAYGLSRLAPACHSVRIEHPAGDEPVEELLCQAGFRPQRSLVQMRLRL
jgi:hypothetical protein